MFLFTNYLNSKIKRADRSVNLSAVFMFSLRMEGWAPEARAVGPARLSVSRHKRQHKSGDTSRKHDAPGGSGGASRIGLPRKRGILKGVDVLRTQAGLWPV